MRLLAPAKINLHLRVAPADGSGFHPILSWMCTVALFDTLTIEPANALALTCDDPRLPCDATNLVLRAARSFKPERSDGPDSFGAKIHLQKRIPFGAGLGGGSSDAARTLLGLDQLWNSRRTTAQLSSTAADLGSDVPFFLHGPSSVCSGRGEIIKKISPPKPKAAVLILCNDLIATPAVYRRFDDMRLGDRAAIADEPDWQQWTDLSAGPLLKKLVNDLEPPAMALCPQLGKLRDEIENLLARPVRMSGSGSSLFTLFDEMSEANAAVDRMGTRRELRVLAVNIAPVLEDDLKK
ncbi:MAG TPA: 4-(cytidine 5'-diphospho)-2-C-methyl-D-erythritol kinase [Tepidisphaeraceae bacterium]|jgi:4-diphosphocytidyl-2-C-methyl-D-erythritol kinase